MNPEKERAMRESPGVEAYEVLVIGAGHAGCEAALAASRMGFRTLLLTLNLDNVAQMSCNPAVGGLAKGHLVREIDALGGEMARVIDQTGIQFRMLNTGRGEAVQAIRAQADKKEYQTLMRRVVESQPGLDLKQATVTKIVPLRDVRPERERTGMSAEGAEAAPQQTLNGESTTRFHWRTETEAGGTFLSKCLVLAPGTFLNGRIHVGFSTFGGGRAGEL
ncbi:MAG: FAD-dependent oxidoreductase, partial [Candidatus Eisenbacteria bacterium]